VSVCLHDNLKTVAGIRFQLGSCVDWRKSWTSLYVKVIGRQHEDHISDSSRGVQLPSRGHK